MSESENDIIEFNENEAKEMNKDKLLIMINDLFDEIEILDGLVELKKNKIKNFKKEIESLKEENKSLKIIIEELKKNEK